MSLYATVEEVKSALNITVATWDSEIQIVIEATSAMFDTLYGETFTQRTVVEYHDGTHSSDGIHLSNHPTESDSDWDSNAVVIEGTTTLVRDTDYFISDPPTRQILRMDGSGNLASGGWTPGTRNIKITVPTRWATIPDDINGLCIDESVRGWQNWNVSGASDGVRVGITSRSNEVGTSLSYAPEELAPKTLRVLEEYRQRRDF